MSRCSMPRSAAWARTCSATPPEVRVEHLGATAVLVHALSQLAAGLRADRAQIHPHFPLTEAGDDAVRSRGHRLHRVVIGERAEHDLDRLGELTRAVGPVQALADEP